MTQASHVPLPAADPVDEYLDSILSVPDLTGTSSSRSTSTRTRQRRPRVEIVVDPNKMAYWQELGRDMQLKLIRLMTLIFYVRRADGFREVNLQSVIVMLEQNSLGVPYGSKSYTYIHENY